MRLRAIVIGLTFGVCAVSAAEAGDISRKDTPYVVSSNWGGAYGGVSFGYAGAHTDYFLNENGHGPDLIDPSGFAGALTLGYNWHLQPRIVLGVEGDLGLMDASDTHNWKDNHVAVSNYGTWATLRGRAGYTFDRLLVYGTGGMAFLGTNEIYYGANGGANAGQTSRNEDTHVGWVAGLGAEYQYSDNWSAKFEYLHMDFPTFNGHTSTDLAYSFQNSADVIRVGINYKFH